MSKSTLLLTVLGALTFTTHVEAKQSIVAQSMRFIDQTTIQAVYDLSQGVPSSTDPSANSEFSFVVQKPATIVSSKYTDLISQAVFFVTDPVTFATYFPAEYAFFFQYGLIFLEPFFEFDFSVYNDLYVQVASSMFGPFFTEVTSFTDASYIDYLYDYLFYGFDIASNSTVQSSSQLLDSSTYSAGCANVQQSQANPDYNVAYDYSYYGYYYGYGYEYDYYFGYYYYTYGLHYGYISDIYHYYPFDDSAIEILTYPDGQTYYYYY